MFPRFSPLTRVEVRAGLVLGVCRLWLSRTLAVARSVQLPGVAIAAGGLFCAALLPGVARAQWVTESYTGKAGWTAIWVGLDLSHTTIDEALAGKTDIEEIWRWNPPSGPQFVTNPSVPVQANPSWNVWKRGLPLQSTLFAFTSNSAYLVKVREGAANVSYTLKGRPVRPDYPWSTSGVNLLGFATAATAPTFAQFLSYGASFGTEPAVLTYSGGGLSSTAPKNPVAILPATETVVRNKAYWVQATQFTNYYGPIALEVAERSGLNFGRSRVAVSVKLKNVTAASRAQNVTVTLTAVNSEAPPAILAGTATMGTTTATLGRVVSIVPDLNPLLTYATPPTVTLSAPAAGTRATATALLNSAGRISGFNVTNSGAGYGATTPTVTVTPVLTGAVPLKIRGIFDPVTSQYAYTSLATASTLTLTPGQETEVVVVADRSAMGTTPGALFGSLLRITDSLGHTRLDLPVSAVSSDLSGLWTGVAVLKDVSQVVGEKVVAMAPATGYATVAGGQVTLVQLLTTGDSYGSVPQVTLVGGGGTGATAEAKVDYRVVGGLQVTAPGSGYTSAPTVVITGGQDNPNSTASQFQLRLIVHRDSTGATRLVQQVYVGSDGSSTTLATAENLFPSTLQPSSRLSSAHFPADFVKLGTGSLAASGLVSFEVLLDYDADTNPFVHRYHPDHDNLDARFETKLTNGRESFTVRRVVALDFKSTLPGVTDPSWGITMLGGTYTETVTGLRSTPLTTQGTFILYRVADGPTLLTP